LCRFSTSYIAVIFIVIFFYSFTFAEEKKDDNVDKFQSYKERSVDSLLTINKSSLSYPTVKNDFYGENPAKEAYLSGIKNSLSQDLSFFPNNTYSSFNSVYLQPLNWGKRDWLIAGTIVTIGGVIYLNDDYLYKTINRNRNTFPFAGFRENGELFEALGLKAKTYKYYFGLLGLSYLINNKKMKSISLDILESSILSFPLTNSIKFSTGRRRPYEGKGVYSYSTGQSDSFFSSHASNVTQLAVILSHHVNYLPFSIVTYSIASSVCLQRITSAKHWPSDVYFGIVWGWFVSNQVIASDKKKSYEITPYKEYDKIGLRVTFSF